MQNMLIVALGLLNVYRPEEGIFLYSPLTAGTIAQVTLSFTTALLAIMIGRKTPAAFAAIHHLTIGFSKIVGLKIIVKDPMG